MSLHLDKALYINRVGPLSYTGIPSLGGQGRAFGGQMVAQGLIAAAEALDVPRDPISIHAQFLAAAKADIELTYGQNWLKKGRSFSVIEVRAIQEKSLKMSCVATFHNCAVTADQQIDAPEVPGFDQCRTSTYIPPETNADVRTCFEIRDVPPLPADEAQGRMAYWLRYKHELEARPALHCAAAVWFTDLSMPWTTELVRTGAHKFRTNASLDHTVWFHRPFDMTKWMLLVQESSTYAGARAFHRGQLYRDDGKLAATAAQETLVQIGAVDQEESLE